jgi:hypothetical protein
MKRESDLIDVWFDSGSMPYAQLHYPFENKELIDDRKASLQTLLQKVLTRQEDGSIHFMQSEQLFLIPVAYKM